MRLVDLTLENIGPFDEAHLEFLSSESEDPPVAIITGENGTGKTILLDAIRGLFGGQYTTLERSIWRPGEGFSLGMTLHVDGNPIVLRSHLPSKGQHFALNPDNTVLHDLPARVARNNVSCPRWIVDFWRTALPADSYEINGLVRQHHVDFLHGSLQGLRRNAAVTELITGFDYLRGSDNEEERRDGEALYDIISRIVKTSVLEGELSHVDRRTFMPMIKQSGQLVPLSNLSSGNAYLIQHLVGLLGKMFTVHVLCKTDTKDLRYTPGLLLIDEAENHLHPRWQKRFLNDIRHIFPNLQIIATTHSPFIVGSVPGARVFVCSFDKEKNTCVVEDASAEYSHKPIEEILLSPAFAGTQPFGEEITNLLEARKAAVESGDVEKRREIEAELKEKNPDYFSYLNIDEKIEALRGERA